MVGETLVSEKLDDKAPAVAITVYVPAVPFAVNGAEAIPEAFVAVVIVAVELLKVPEAPGPGAVNVTFTPEMGLLPASLIVTANALPKAVPIFVLCGVVPAFALIDVAAPAVFVNEKLTVVRPVAAAVTV